MNRHNGRVWCQWKKPRSAIIILAAMVLSGCDQLLEVDFPGTITAEELNDPALATTLALSAQAQFDCWFQDYLLTTALWTQEAYYVFTSCGFTARSLRAADFATSVWDGGTGANCAGFYRPMQIARGEAERLAEIISSFDPAAVSGSRDYLAGSALAYAGYVYLLAGEALCEMAYDGGALQTREDSWRIAEQRFTTVLQLVGGVTGADAAAARSIANMARVGRARARLNLGNGPGAVSDAMEVDPGFERLATTSSGEDFRFNLMFDRITRIRHASVHEDYHHMTVSTNGRLTQNDGVVDPRVPLVHYGEGTGFDGVTDMWGQLKYTSLATPVPFATWREAQLMIAEVRGGQEAVSIINNLRDTHNLPHFSSTDPNEIAQTVREERRRELFLQGTRIGDKIRWNESWIVGFDAVGREYNESLTCIPLHQMEFETNPNISR